MEFIPDYAIAYECHELTQIKPIKYIGLCLDENVIQGLFAILKIFFGFIRVIRGLLHNLGLLFSFVFIRVIRRIVHHPG